MVDIKPTNQPTNYESSIAPVTYRRTRLLLLKTRQRLFPMRDAITNMYVEHITN